MGLLSLKLCGYATEIQFLSKCNSMAQRRMLFSSTGTHQEYKRVGKKSKRKDCGMKEWT